ncbi:hypothetical protein F383_31848 [Gossypium arboreum]|uniref:Uncharacterized protein n=1 Tax=Gossypium arboreum TaxID=29729 RepID=A0A0B0MZD3_GOSAR|nr:hypothetical protein F383_31848 [Gossypium arboreum]
MRCQAGVFWLDPCIRPSPSCVNRVLKLIIGSASINDLKLKTW